jgi:hypothetical protein
MNLTYRSGKTEVLASRIHGLGLFAKTKISAGEIVAVKGGYIFAGRDWRAVEPALGSAEIQVAEDLFIAPSMSAERDGGMIYINHSCDPNVAIQGQIVFVAMRDIPAGEELTHDWATTDDTDHRMECRCGSPDCRKVITGKDWMKPELQLKYAGCFCWFIQRKMDALAKGRSQ